MTREQAIIRLNRISNSLSRYCDVNDCIRGNCAKCYDAINMAIEALEKEPKRGKWILKNRETDGNYRYMCSECGHIDISAKTQEVPYCWYCGARMESDTE